MSTSKKLLGRQPIVNRSLRTYGYELLFREESDDAYPQVKDGSKATRTVINTILYLGIGKVVGSAKAFVNFTENLLTSDEYTLLPEEQLVIEVLETVEPTEKVIKACREIKKRGYPLALDDFTSSETTPLVELADIVKVDIRECGIHSACSLAYHLKKLGKVPLAEKVETFEEFQELKAHGFQLFQGYFFSKPQLIEEKDIPPRKLSLIRAIGELSQRADARTLEEIISRDPALAYKLLKYINSAIFNLRSPVSNIRRAIAYLGEENVTKWLILIALSEVGVDKPEELVVLSILRANMAEELAKRLGNHSLTLKAYTAGILSLMDAMLNRRMKDILEMLPLEEDIKHALISGKGIIGSIISIIKTYEKLDFYGLKPLIKDTKLSMEDVENAYLDALSRTITIINAPGSST